LSVLEKFYKDGRLRDYVNLKEVEVVIAFHGTLFIMVLFYFLELYEDFYYIQEGISNLLLYFIGGFIGLLGVVLTGVAIVISLFENKVIEKIREINEEDPVDQVLTSFEFLAYNLGFLIVYLVFLFISINSLLPLINIIILFYHINCKKCHSNGICVRCQPSGKRQLIKKLMDKHLLPTHQSLFKGIYLKFIVFFTF